jgi:hypothetical protein
MASGNMFWKKDVVRGYSDRILLSFPGIYLESKK